MRAFLRRWRWWLWGSAACVLALSVPGALYFFAEESDGSEEVLDRIQLGMTLEQVCEVLGVEPPPDNAFGRARPGEVGAIVEPPFLLTTLFRDHEVRIAMDNRRTGVIFKARIEHPRTRWWTPLLTYWNRVRAALGS